MNRVLLFAPVKFYHFLLWFWEAMVGVTQNCSIMMFNTQKIIISRSDAQNEDADE